MLIINRLLVVVAALWVCSSAKGDTRLDTPLDRYILDSDVIAIVEVGAREKDLGGEGKYRLTTEATVKRVLKGEVPKTIKVLHGMGFDGLLFQNGAGLYLVFLSNGVEAYTPFDGWPSSKLIKDEKVLGWEHHPYFWYDSGTALQSALDKIEALLKSGKTSAPAGQPPATGLSESPKLAPAN